MISYPSVSFFENKRFFRFILAALLVAGIIIYVFPAGVPVASASDTGTINLLDSRTTNHLQGGVSAAGDITFEVFKYDTSNYNYISWFRINDTAAAYSLTKSDYSSRFTCTVGCTGGGVAWYASISGDNVTWVFDSSTYFNGEAGIFITYEKADFPGTIVESGQNVVPYALSANDPLALLSGAGINHLAGGVITSVGAEVHTTNSYQADWNYTALGLGVNISVWKNATIKSLVRLEDADGNLLSLESGVADNNNFNTFVLSDHGLAINLSLPSGTYFIQVVNSTGATYQPDIPPDLGIEGIAFGARSYYENQDANLYYKINREFLHTYDIDLVYIDETGTESRQSIGKNILSDSGNYSVWVTSGTKQIRGELIKCLSVLCSVVASDTVSVSSALDSTQIQVSTLRPYAGIVTNISVKVPTTPNDNDLIVVEKYIPEWGDEGNEEYVIEGVYEVKPKYTASNTWFNVSIRYEDSAEYQIYYRTQFGATCCLITGIYAIPYRNATKNISVPWLNLTHDVFMAGQYLDGDYGIDNTNFSKTLYHEVYDVSRGISYTSYAVLTQIGRIDNLLISGDTTCYQTGDCSASEKPFQVGVGQHYYRIKDSNNNIILSQSFNVTAIDSQGYSFIVNPLDICPGDKVVMKYRTPAVSNITIETFTGTLIKSILLAITSDSKSIEQIFMTPGDYAVKLVDSSGYARFQYNIHVGTTTCATKTEAKGEESPFTALWGSNVFWAVMVLFMFAGVGFYYAGVGGGVIGGGLGVISGALLEWIPLWAIFLFAAVAFIGAAIVITSGMRK